MRPSSSKRRQTKPSAKSLGLIDFHPLDILPNLPAPDWSTAFLMSDWPTDLLTSEWPMDLLTSDWPMDLPILETLDPDIGSRRA